MKYFISNYVNSTFFILQFLTMKIKNHLIYLLFFLTSFYSCKKETVKENTTEKIVKSDNYKKIKYIILNQDNEIDTLTFHYNLDGTYKDFSRFYNSSRTIWTYESGGYLVKSLDSNNNSHLLYRCEYNANKIVKSIYRSDDTLNLFYSDGLLTSTIGKKYNTINNFYWKNGNIIKSISKYNGAVDSLTYNYYDTKNHNFWKVLGLNNWNFLYEGNVIGFQFGCEFSNLIKNIKNSKGQIIQDFEYQYDKDGYVVTSKSTGYEYYNGNLIPLRPLTYYIEWY